MNIKQYVIKLRAQIASANPAEDSSALRRKLQYAQAYARGEEGLKQYRARAVAAKIEQVHNKDAQLAILFNEHIHPEEYEAYQAFRVECKAAVSAEMAVLKAELEAILNQ